MKASEHKSTRAQDPLSNYLNGGNDLLKTLKTAVITTIIFITIIIIFKPIFPAFLLLIAILITINAYFMKQNLKQYHKTLLYGLSYATILHYLFWFAGRWGFMGVGFVMLAAITYKFFIIKKRINKIFDEVNIK